jgi:chromosome partitioning protein
MDLWATTHIAKVIERLRPENPGLKALIVMSQLEPRTTLSRLMPDAALELDLPVAAIGIRRRSIHRHCALEGRSVFQAGKRGRDAADEIHQLLTELLDHG